jgi:succinate dehydrogenase/fumarate reductase flavoprotein subunit
MARDDLVTTDVLVIGCGIAGGVAALQLADAGLHVTVVTLASQAEESNTYYAQGGIIFKGLDDSPELLVEDVMRAGAGLSYRRAVEILAREGPPLVASLPSSASACPSTAPMPATSRSSVRAGTPSTASSTPPTPRAAPSSGDSSPR